MSTKHTTKFNKLQQVDESPTDIKELNLAHLLENGKIEVVVRSLGFEPRIAYAPGMYPEPC